MPLYYGVNHRRTRRRCQKWKQALRQIQNAIVFMGSRELLRPSDEDPRALLSLSFYLIIIQLCWSNAVICGFEYARKRDASCLLGYRTLSSEAGMTVVMVRIINTLDINSLHMTNLSNLFRIYTSNLILHICTLTSRLNLLTQRSYPISSLSLRLQISHRILHQELPINSMQEFNPLWHRLPSGLPLALEKHTREPQFQLFPVLSCPHLKQPITLPHSLLFWWPSASESYRIRTAIHDLEVVGDDRPDGELRC